jgi:hypothetical protein
VFVLLQEGGCPIARHVCLIDRLAARLRARRLDRQLALGASPDASVALALRAQALVAMSVRRDLARSARRVLAAARTPGATRLAVPVCRDRVTDSAAEFDELIGRLLAACPVPAQGVARASVLLCDGSGPLYHRACPDDLRTRVREAASALSPLSPQGSW